MDKRNEKDRARRRNEPEEEKKIRLAKREGKGIEHKEQCTVHLGLCLYSIQSSVYDAIT